MMATANTVTSAPLGSAIDVNLFATITYHFVLASRGEVIMASTALVPWLYRLYVVNIGSLVVSLHSSTPLMTQSVPVLLLYTHTPINSLLIN